jgi:hypothetical protein
MTDLLYHPSDGQPMLMAFGGYNGSSEIQSPWAMRVTDLVWSNLSTTGAPSARREGGLAWAPTAQRAVVWGGQTGLVPVAATNTYHYDPVANTWSTESPVPTPSARGGFAFRWASGPERIVLFGGTIDGTATGRLGDWWYYDPVTAYFQNRSTSATEGVGRPEARFHHAAAAAGDKFWIYGGVSASSKTDVWELALSSNTWTKLASDCGSKTSSCPGPRAAAGMIYWASKKALVVYGGDSGVAENTTYMFDLNKKIWTQLCATGCVTPTGISFTEPIFDPVEHALLWWGGDTSVNSPTNQLWRLFLK